MLISRFTLVSFAHQAQYLAYRALNWLLAPIGLHCTTISYFETTEEEEERLHEEIRALEARIALRDLRTDLHAEYADLACVYWHLDERKFFLVCDGVCTSYETNLRNVVAARKLVQAALATGTGGGQ